MDTTLTAPPVASGLPASAPPHMRPIAAPRTTPGAYGGWCWRPHSADWRAGWVSALVMLPQAIAFAVLAGLPPEMGIYSSIVPVIVAALLGPSALLLSGPNTAVAVMLGIALLPLGAPGSHNYLVFAATLTAMVGIVQVVLAFGGIGRLLAQLPRFTAAGLNMGIGLIMLSCQIGPAMGLLASRDTPSWLGPVVYAQRWAEANPWALGVTITAIVGGLLFERWRKSWIPSLVAAMLFGGLAGLGLDLTLGLDATRLDRVGHLHLHLDIIQWPSFKADELYVLKQLALSAVTIALVGALQSVIILQSTQPGADAGDCRRELLAQAGSNLSASVCGGFACSGSFNRTAAHIDAGAVTRKAAVISSVLLLVLALVAAPAFAYLTRAAIAGTLALVGWSMLRSGWRQASRSDSRSRWAALVLALAVPFAGIESALLLAVVFTVARPLLRRPGLKAVA